MDLSSSCCLQSSSPLFRFAFCWNQLEDVLVQFSDLGVVGALVLFSTLPHPRPVHVEQPLFRIPNQPSFSAALGVQRRGSALVTAEVS